MVPFRVTPCPQNVMLFYNFRYPWRKLRSPGASQKALLVMMTPVAMFPLLLAWDLAVTSSRCDALMSALNLVRARKEVREAPPEEAVNAEMCLNRLECFLNKLHNGQGLGFTLFGNVVDKRRLTATFVALASGVSSLVVYLAAIGDSSVAGVDSSSRCALAQVVHDVLRANFQQFNASCDFAASNATLASLLVSG